MPEDPFSIASPPSQFTALPVFRSIDAPGTAASANLELTVSLELGRVRMRLADVLEMTEGSVLELDKFAGDPVDVVVNDQLIARGEVVVLNEKFAVRIVKVMAAAREM